MSPRPARAILVLATLVAGCASLPPQRSIEGLLSLAGTWRGRMTGPTGSAPVLGGVISATGPGRTRYGGTEGNGTVTLHEDGGRRVLSLVRDGGGGGARLTPGP
jgi:hypothetical protein